MVAVSLKKKNDIPYNSISKVIDNETIATLDKSNRKLLIHTIDGVLLKSISVPFGLAMNVKNHTVYIGGNANDGEVCYRVDLDSKDLLLQNINLPIPMGWGKAVDDFAVDWIEEANSLAFAYTGTPDGEETCDESEKIIQAIQNADGILSRAEIIKISGVSERTVDRMLKSLVEKGILLAKKSGRFMDYFLTDDKGNTEE